MSTQAMNELQAQRAKRIRELLKGKIASLPGLSFGDDELEAIYGPVSKAINQAYAQGWADAEIDFIGSLGVLGLMGEDPRSREELWEIAQKRPRSEEGLLYRRDWFEHDYAQDQLKLAGIDPWGKRPESPPKLQRATAKKKPAKKKKAAKAKR